MANDITASAILAQKAITSLTEQFPIVGLFSTNYGTELTALGQSVNVPVFGATGAVKKTGKGASIDYAEEAAKNSGDWEKTTLGALVGSAKSRAVKLARQGVKSLAGPPLHRINDMGGKRRRRRRKPRVNTGVREHHKPSPALTN